MSAAQPKELISCYDDLGFEQHEWGKHGVCAGVKDAKDFFTQVCALSAAPLRVMAATVAAGGDVARAAADLKAAGYAIFGTDAKNSQVELSACADASGTWHLAAISDFAATCEAAYSDNHNPNCTPTRTLTLTRCGAGPAPTPPPAGQCVPEQHGPPCKTDADCAHVPGCLRCAHSGFCSMEPRPAATEGVVEA